MADVDLSDMVSKGGVFSSLSRREAFDAVRVGESNRSVEWPQPTDELGYPLVAIDADALYAKSLRQEEAMLATSMRKITEPLRRARRVTANTDRS